MSRLPDTIAGNIIEWTRRNEENLDRTSDPSTWAEGDLVWGLFHARDDEMGSPIGDVDGLDVVELGCGTAYWSARLAKRGARPVGVDPTPAQLATARRMQEATGTHFPLVEAPAEQVPLPDDAFDLAFSEYGASLWAEPSMWIEEAARLLRPGGRLVFLTNSTLMLLCVPDVGDITTSLQRPQNGMGATTWPDSPATEYHLDHGAWIRLLRSSGFEVIDLIEVFAPADAKTHPIWGEVPAEWARQWPAEDIWVARLAG